MSVATLCADLAQAAVALPPLLTRKQAADFAQVDRRTLSRWIASGRLRAAKSHPSKQGRVLVCKAALLALLAGEAA
ncbi:MAG: helix-turn-helix domain-containing protein [Planctomycetes bacterium]|nr:helix-turn-helix domain-containing protein [Planctomycetota bacterium]